MPSNASSRTVRRHALLAGSAMFALLLSATAAQAQSVTATATGAQALANEQSLRTGTVTADASDAVIRSVASGDIDHSDLGVTDDTVTAASKGNAAKLDLAGTSHGPAAYRIAGLTAGPNRASATGDTVVASHQSLGGTLVNGKIVDTRVSMTVGSATASSLRLTGNTQDAAATGNDVAPGISAPEGGAGIAVSQTMDSRSTVAGRALGGFSVVTGALMSSDVDAGGNSDRAVGTGNSAVSALTLDAPLLALDPRNDAASIVSASSGDAVVNAAAATGISQTASGEVRAAAFQSTGDPVFAIEIGGNATGSSIASDRNTLSSAARGNAASASTLVTVASVPPSSEPASRPGAIATSVTVQKASDLSLVSHTIGGTRLIVDGTMAGSAASASNNMVRSTATANESGSEMTLSAATIGAAGRPGIATVSGTGLSTADAGAVMQLVQDYGAGTVSSLRRDARVGIAVAGAVDGSKIAVEGNSDLVAATGNEGANMLALDAGTIGTSVAVNALQTGNGDVLASSREAGLVGGARVTVDGQASDSLFAIRDNRYLASAIGNLGTNGITVTTDTLRGALGPARSGAMGDGYGAAGDVALASNQKLGEPTNEGTLIPTIESEIFTQSGIAANSASRSTLAVEDNAQQATAIGNTVANQLSVKATVLGADTALASTQYGQAVVSATSEAAWRSGGDAGSSASLSTNGNAALAAINDAENGLSIDAAVVPGTGISDAASDLFGPPVAQGDHVLANQQFAAGSAAALVNTTLGLGGPATGSDGSTYRVTGNHTTGEATANRAVNSLSLQAAGGKPGAALASTQMNAASTQVTAIGSTEVPVGISRESTDVAIDDNSVSALARGNAADNSISLAGAGIPGSTGHAVTDRFGAEASGGAALLNSQANFAPVTASGVDTSTLVPLNAVGLDGARVSFSGNVVSASGFGNVATNSVSVSGPSPASAAIANNQVNNGNVYAIVTGSHLDGTTGAIGASNFSMSGNILSATAVGNQVSSAITAPR